MRLIDADALIEQMESDAEEIPLSTFRMAYHAAISDVKHQPIIEERKTGKWKKLSGSWFHNDVQCSECGNTLDMNGVNAGRGDANFCPNCGADMRGEKDE